MGQLLLDHPLSCALTTTVNVPVVYLKQFWKTVSKVLDTKDTIKFKLDTHEIVYDVDMFRSTLKLPVKTPENPFIALVTIKMIEPFMQTVSYEGVVDKLSVFFTKCLAQPWQTMFKVFSLTTRTSGHDQTKINILQIFHTVMSVYTTRNVIDRGMLIPDALLTDAIRDTDYYKEYETVFVKKKFTYIPPPSDDRERDEIAEATLLSLTMHKTDLTAKGQENIAKPGNHKENPEFVVDDDDYVNEKEKKDDKKDDEKKDDVVEKKDADAEKKDNDDHTDHTLVGPQTKGSLETRIEHMQTPIPTLPGSPKKTYPRIRLFLKN
nr:hypothetical protein [Tanacetum cinerariifolium]